jgi:hypothetical protein
VTPGVGCSTRVTVSQQADLASQSACSDARSLPCDSRTYNGLKVRFSATVGEEPVVELALV